MESQGKHFEYEVKDVVDWTKQTELAYWKARAMALECENTMLLDCIKEICTNDINKKIIDGQNLLCTNVKSKRK